MKSRIPIVALALIAAGMTGCSATEPGPDTDIRLKATGTAPVDIRLDWKGAEPGTALQAIEFATEPDKYTTLGFLPAAQRTYEHLDLIPETPFYYRVRPVHGPASEPVLVNLRAESFDPPAAEPDVSWADPRIVPDSKAVARTIGEPRTEGAAAPTALRATVMTRDAIKFTWSDNASDEEGYLLEVKPEQTADWTVAMAIDPNINSVGLTVLATERSSAFRVRAYRYGESSNVVHRITGKNES